MHEEPEWKGLSPEEVEVSRLQYGSNKIGKEEGSRFFSALKDVVAEPMFLILVCAAIIYFVLGESGQGVIMLIALGIVSGISLFQESRSRNAVAALNKLAAPSAKVIRGGKIIEIDAEDVVVDDIIMVEDGKLVPADATALRLNDFSVNESTLTGESLPVFKGLEEPGNTIFQGTMVMSGSCTAKVTAVGKQTMVGKLGESLQFIETEKTPLQLQIRGFTRMMVFIGAIAFLLVWGYNYYLTKNILHGLLHGLTLAMSILPEEIPVAFSTFMALGAYRLYKKQVIARSPYTVETLGAATVICTDKTGTITENHMALAAVYDHATGQVNDYSTSGPGYSVVLEFAMWSSETLPFDAMEISIHEAYAKTAPVDHRSAYRMIHEYPLGGTPPMMTHVFSNGNGHTIIASKGGVESILRQTDLAATEQAGVMGITGEMARKGYRVLAVGKCDYDHAPLPLSQQDFSLQLLGLIAFYDPPKKNMNSIIQTFYDAGINVKMITGDYAETASAIGEQIQLRNASEVLTGAEVMRMDIPRLQKEVEKVNVFARMFPDAKLKVIEALKADGEVVAMTGDGVNDAPALKASHIAVAMGLRGSEVAKSASSMVLMDDDLTHMTDAVALGRRIYENLKKAIRYIISIHIPIILIVTMPLVLFWKYTDIFSPLHVIFLELIMGPTCSIIFENEPIEADSMKKNPRKMSTRFFSFHELLLSIVQGLVITVACLSVGWYFMHLGQSEAYVRTAIYSTLIFCNLFLTLANRSFHFSIFKTIRYNNWMIPAVLGISLLVLLLSIYVKPVQELFLFVQLPAETIAICLGAAFLGVIWVEGFKWIRRRA